MNIEIWSVLELAVKLTYNDDFYMWAVLSVKNNITKKLQAQESNMWRAICHKHGSASGGVKAVVIRGR